MKTLIALALLTNTIVNTISIEKGGYLWPDTYSYAAGHSAWSSPILAATGQLLGLKGIQILSIGCIIALNYMIWRKRNDRPKHVLAASLLLLAGPWNSALATASADALGAGLILLAANRRPTYLPLAVLGHLASGLAGTFALALRRTLALTPALTIAGTAEIVLLYTHPFWPSNGYPTEIQWRYLLPAVVSLATSAKLHLNNPVAAHTPHLEKAARGEKTEVAENHRPVLHPNAPLQNHDSGAEFSATKGDPLLASYLAGIREFLRRAA